MSPDSPRFMVDFMLGKLARNLRFLGFDTVYIRHSNRKDILRRSLEEGRIILTRAHSFPKRNDIYIIETDNPFEQTREIVKVFKLSPEPFTRCVICNLPIERIDKKEVKDKVPPFVFKTQNEFARCAGCGRIYWKGTHYENISKVIDELIKEKG